MWTRSLRRIIWVTQSYQLLWADMCDHLAKGIINIGVIIIAGAMVTIILNFPPAQHPN